MKTNLQKLMSKIGSAKTPAKAAAARINGKAGGRPVNPSSARQQKLSNKTKN